MTGQTVEEHPLYAESNNASVVGYFPVSHDEEIEVKDFNYSVSPDESQPFKWVATFAGFMLSD